MALKLWNNNNIKSLIRLYNRLGLRHEARELEWRIQIFSTLPWRGKKPDGIFNGVPCYILELDPFRVKLFLATGDIIDVPIHIFESRFIPLK